jgi:steroid delta-isomerase-like uncharacterized protein
MSTIENKALVRRWFEEVWNKGRVAAIDEILASDAVLHGLVSDDVPGVAGFKRLHAAFRNAFPDMVEQIDDMAAEGDIVAVRWSGTGTHRGEILGVAATGRRVRFNGMDFVRFKQDKVVEGWTVFDHLTFLQQLGVTNLSAAGFTPLLEGAART